jgi:hypothetical protein
MSSKGLKLTLKRNKKLDKIFHSETNLVFKSINEKIVIGRLEGDKFLSLDGICIELCEEWGLSYDESLIEKTSSTEEENEEQPKEETKEETKENLIEQPKEETKENLIEQRKEETKENLIEQRKEQNILKQQINHPDIYQSLEYFKNDLVKHNLKLHEKISSLEQQLQELNLKYQEAIESKRKLKQIISEM